MPAQIKQNVGGKRRLNMAQKRQAEGIHANHSYLVSVGDGRLVMMVDQYLVWNGSAELWSSPEKALEWAERHARRYIDKMAKGARALPSQKVNSP
jgi:hypothetical protein